MAGFNASCSFYGERVTSYEASISIKIGGTLAGFNASCSFYSRLVYANVKDGCSIDFTLFANCDVTHYFF